MAPTTALVKAQGQQHVNFCSLGCIRLVHATVGIRARDARRPAGEACSSTHPPSEIVRPVLEAATTVADTSELFMRALQLTALCERPTRNHRPTQNGAASEQRGEGIGAHVRATMADLAESGRLTSEVVAELSSARYCKQRFNLGHAFLKPVDPVVDLPGQRRDANGYARYWAHPVSIRGHRFLTCHEWYDRQRTAFDQWVRDLG